MSELRGPVRHGNRARRPPRPVAAPRSADGASPTTGGADGAPVDDAATSRTSSDDLQAVFTALARRSKLPTVPEARPTEVLRAAGLPLLLAAIMASGQGATALDGAEAAPAPGNPQPGLSGWTVTTPQQRTDPQASAAVSGAAVGAAAQTTQQPRPRTTPTTATTTPKPASKTAPKSTPKVAPKTAPKVAAKSAPKTTPKTAPRTVAGPAARPVTRAPATTARPATAPVPSGRQYVVRAGDTLSGISHAQQVPLQALLDLNRLRMDSVIHPGDRLRLPATPGAVSARTAPGAAAGVVAGRTYVVRPNDSLIGICQEQHVKLPDVLQLNGLHLESVIHPGDRLRLPAAPAPATAGGHAYPPAVVAAANANRLALAHARVPTREQVQALVVSTARSMGVDPALALGVAYLESGFQQRVVSPANAVGVMQVIPSAGRWASTMVGRPLDLLDAKDNIVAGVALLHALTRAADTEAQAVAGYYQGLTSVQQHGMFDDTRRYVANVQTLKARFATGH